MAIFPCDKRYDPKSILLQGMRDFLFAINLSSLVGVCLDVIQSSEVKVHYGFPGNRLPSTTSTYNNVTYGQ